jgi:hypothetical protein
MDKDESSMNRMIPEEAALAMVGAAAVVADSVADTYATATYCSEDGRLQNAAKVYCAGEIATGIRALAAPDSDGRGMG